ncbi:uncharacterized protein BP01DRAFT_301762 [Aspergillus saccharolyticus JOP 1030-1]|uniref:Transcription factor domain-containing protein n=1 Tax=Aspergillus saccharolyticus JOP 1030-1 TaxID=1450539 RepID=A0A318Z9P4_9EURO|nr:hypothetical protein BP01DRAFT_301762 [Aspergillus saccharolyticus JOP 1030-1]PYH43074.1 hypothetical protein BP01DRAFT_301762 [Aspergillus saccharolyticus JOP 1030-1]
MLQKPLDRSPSIPAVPTQNIRSLIQRPRLHNGAQRTANLIFHALKSYPKMMLRDRNLPPFIHPHMVFSDAEGTSMEPLTNCLSLVHMTSSPAESTRKLFWKNVHWECERLYTEYNTLTRWQLLAAMQALSIYLIIRLDEGETEYNDFDLLLLSTVTVMAKRLGERTADQGSGHIRTPWKDWVFQESTRRLCVIYQVVNMLVYFDPAAICDHQTDIPISSLPARKQLWEAGDEIAWRVEKARESVGNTTFGMAVDGELVRISQNDISCYGGVIVQNTSSNRQIANWEDWCSGMDDMGGLVMLAASLVG